MSGTMRKTVGGPVQVVVTKSVAPPRPSHVTVMVRAAAGSRVRVVSFRLATDDGAAMSTIFSLAALDEVLGRLLAARAAVAPDASPPEAVPLTIGAPPTVEPPVVASPCRNEADLPRRAGVPRGRVTP